MALSASEVDELLSGAHVAVLSTVGADGSPAQAPIWYLWIDGAAVMLTGRSSRKWRNILRDPRVSLCVDTKQPPYRVATIEGRAEEIPGDYRALLKQAAVRYLGTEAGERYLAASTSGGPESVIFRVAPDRTITYG
jgi:PPOX class probable F420-dependent enzyme